MASFRTSVPKLPFPFRINHQSKVLCMGSCFAEHIGQKLEQSKFSTFLNPFGIAYNPHSIAEQLHLLVENKQFRAEDLIRHNDLWHSFQHHSRFSGIEQAEVLTRINQHVQEGHHFLKKTNVLTITLGTSYVFSLKKSGQIVTNCHKLPAQSFDRKRLALEDMISGMASVFQTLKSNNPELNILVTVSPVRHIRDGLIENQRSKALLLLACEQWSKTFDFVHYFPAYEIMMDELRGYRFYEKDMLHPSTVAIDYIWQYFSDIFFDRNTFQLNSRLEKIAQAIRHRAFHPQSEKHQLFIKSQLKNIEQLLQEHPSLNFDKELESLQAQLID